MTSATTASGAPRHSWAYRRRRFLNWFTLGLTYATYYMGRYNLNVIKPHMEKAFFGGSQTQFGIIGLCGFWTYAASELVNGPLADRIGGRKAIIIGAAGAGLFNFVMGMVFLGGWFGASVLLAMCLLYSLNMFFQSFGAMSVVKVNAPWFHVDERGGFGGVFGIMISSGYTLAFMVSGFILAHSFGEPKATPLHLFGHAFYIPWYWTFLAPSVALAIMLVISAVTVKDRPSDAGFENFSTNDASDGDETPVTFQYIIREVFTNPILLTLMAAEFCTGFVRQSLLFFAPDWLLKVHHLPPSAMYWFGPAISIGGIVGGLVAGYSSDWFFQARRPPVAFLFYLAQIVFIIGLGMVSAEAAIMVMIGLCCAVIFGVHGMLSGTASMDFGGGKGAATAAGMLDGIQYVASGITSVAMGAMIDHFGWGAWTWCIVPFSFIGALLMLKLWNAKPRPKRQEPDVPLTVEAAGGAGGARTGS